MSTSESGLWIPVAWQVNAIGNATGEFRPAENSEVVAVVRRGVESGTIKGEVRDDLWIECPHCGGSGWEDGCAHGPYRLVAHAVPCGTKKVWECRTFIPLSGHRLVIPVSDGGSET